MPHRGLRWPRQIVAEKHESPFVKTEAMKVAGKVLSEPKLYCVAIKAADTAVAKLPRAFIYNPFNAWGKQREVPDAPGETFRDWYLTNRKAK